MKSALKKRPSGEHPSVRQYRETSKIIIGQTLPMVERLNKELARARKRLGLVPDSAKSGAASAAQDDDGVADADDTLPDGHHA